MRETALLQLVKIQLQLHQLRCLLHVGQVGDIQPTRAVHDGNLFILQIDHIFGVLYDRGCIRTKVKLLASRLALSYADNQRAAFAGADYLVGVALLQNGNGICAHHVLQCQLHSRIEVTMVRVHHILHQLNQHLGIGLTDKCHVILLQLSTQSLVVLDDAVVHQSQILRLRIVRMGIGCIGLAVCRPTGVRDADGATHILVGHAGLQSRHLTFGLVDQQFTLIVDQRHTCAVVTTILQTMQSVNQDRVRLLLPDVSNYSTHSIIIYYLLNINSTKQLYLKHIYTLCTSI